MDSLFLNHIFLFIFGQVYCLTVQILFHRFCKQILSEMCYFYQCCGDRGFLRARIHLESVKSSPITGLEWPRGFQEVKVPRFHDNGTGWW
jgi:hypothetical protein